LYLIFPNRPTLAEDALWQKLIGEAKQLRREKRYVEAEKQMLLGLAEAEKFGPEDRRLAVTLNELAALYHASLRFSEAEPVYRRALGVWEKFPDCLEEATALSNLARLCLERGNYAEVESLSARALAISQSLAPKHPEVAHSLNNLADVHTLRRRYAAAESLYRQALSILEDSLGPDHPEVAYGLNHLARVSFLQARFAESEALYRRAVAILQKTPGQKPSTLASGLTGLAELAANKGRNSEAELLYQQAQAIWEQLLGAEHPNIGLCLYSRARVCRRLGRFADAEALYRRALMICEKVPGQEMLVGGALDDLAQLYLAQGRYPEVEPLLRRALSIQERKLGPDHPDISSTLNTWATFVRFRGTTRRQNGSFGRLFRSKKRPLGRSTQRSQLS
jgi:tetratricopeptide (TPR) repeat protein